MVGRRCASIVLPKPGSSDPRVRLRGRITVPRRIINLSSWVEEENRHGGHVCQCGCRKPIQVLPQHHAKGIPKYLRAHHPMAMTQETRRLREQGLLTSGVVARELGVSFTTLRRLEGKLFEPVPREGKRGLRVFTPEQVEQIREALRKMTRLGAEPELLSLEEVACRVGCSSNTIRRHQGTELPAGRRLAEPRDGWGFTRTEAEQIAAWAKQHVRGRGRFAGACHGTEIQGGNHSVHEGQRPV
jgi:hypothetical protein